MLDLGLEFGDVLEVAVQFLLELLDLIVPLQDGHAGLFQLAGAFKELFLQLTDFCLQAVSQLFCVSSRVIPFLLQLLKQIIDLSLHLGFHLIKLTLFGSLQGFHFLLVFSQGLSVQLIERGFHLVLLGGVLILHLLHCLFMVLLHFSYFGLQLFHEVAALVLQHFDLALKVLDFVLVGIVLLLCLRDLVLLLLFQLSDLSLELRNLCFQFLHLLGKFVDLVDHVLVGGLQDVVQSVDFRVQTFFFSLSGFLVLLNSRLETLDVSHRFLEFAFGLRK